MLATSLVLLGLAAASYTIRKLAPEGHFLHTPFGAALLALVSAAIPAAIGAIQAHGLDEAAISQAVTAALLSLLATSNPSDAGAGPKPLLALALVGFGAISCAHVPPAVAAFGKAFGACMEAKGLAEAPGLASQVFSILANGSGSAGSIGQQLEGLLGPTGQAVLEDTMLCAVSAWLGQNPVAPAAPPTPSQAAARVFLARHAPSLRH